MGFVLSAGCWADTFKTLSPTAIEGAIQRQGESAIILSPW